MKMTEHELDQMNRRLAIVDSASLSASGKPEDQIALLMMATVLALRRFLNERGIIDRGRRMRVIKATVSEFDAKLRQHVWGTPTEVAAKEAFDETGKVALTPG